MSYLIAVDRPWCDGMDKRLSKKFKTEFLLISNKASLNSQNLEKISPSKIFFPFWSSRISKEIYEKYECVIFHMTDLPYGRGGSPLQNLIIRKKTSTKLSALKCIKTIDGGPVYLKKNLILSGNAKEIFIRASKIIEDMVEEIIKLDLKPTPQKGKVTEFSRRSAVDGDWSKSKSLDEVYDYIRMLDAENYPNAFVKVGKFKLEFSDCIKELDCLSAKVIIKKE